MNEKCRVLKQIRKNIAEVLNIDLNQTECTYEGKCSGTCPKCRQEERRLNQALLSRGAVAAGVVAMGLSLTACADAGKPQDAITPELTPTSAYEDEPFAGEAVIGEEPEDMLLEGEVPEETTDEMLLEGDIVAEDWNLEE